MVQARQPENVQQSCISIFATYLTIPSTNYEHLPRHDNSIPCVAIWQIYRDTKQPQQKHTSLNESRLQFSWRQFQQQRKSKSPNPIQKRKSTLHLKRLFFLMNRLIHFYINTTKVIRPVKQNQLSFSSIETKKPLLAPVYSFSQIRFKFRGQFQFQPQMDA